MTPVTSFASLAQFVLSIPEDSSHLGLESVPVVPPAATAGNVDVQVLAGIIHGYAQSCQTYWNHAGQSQNTSHRAVPICVLGLSTDCDGVRPCSDNESERGVQTWAKTEADEVLIALPLPDRDLSVSSDVDLRSKVSRLPSRLRLQGSLRPFPISTSSQSLLNDTAVHSLLSCRLQRREYDLQHRSVHASARLLMEKLPNHAAVRQASPGNGRILT